jgi:hypothetical protein
MVKEGSSVKQGLGKNVQGVAPGSIPHCKTKGERFHSVVAIANPEVTWKIFLAVGP